MKKLVRSFSLLFKNVSIHLETKRLKREIKNAYSEKPSAMPNRKLLWGVFSLLLLIGGFVSYRFLMSQKRVESPSISINQTHIPTNNSTKDMVLGDADSLTRDTTAGISHAGVKDSLLALVTSEPITSSEDSSTSEIKRLDSNIIKKSYPVLKERGDLFKHLLVADKSDKIIHLFSRHGTGWYLTRTFPVASGAKQGKKMVRGDLRTPEGIYFIEGRKEGDSLNEIYGPLAYVLNYPNRHDVAAGRTGNGIWIHGTTPGEVPVDTKGCLELHNDNLIKLSNILGKGDMVPVIIHSKEGAPFDEVVDLETVWSEREYILNERREKLLEASRADSLAKAKVALADSLKEARLADLEALKSAVITWASLWETMEIDSYSLAYDTVHFSVPGYDWSRWKEKKINTFERYKSIDIDVSRLSPKLITDSTAVVVFRQVYKSDRFRAVDKKKLNMKKVASQWKITAEVSLP